jgi:hypothetical protein
MLSLPSHYKVGLEEARRQHDYVASNLALDRTPEIAAEAYRGLIRYTEAIKEELKKGYKVNNLKILEEYVSAVEATLDLMETIKHPLVKQMMYDVEELQKTVYGARLEKEVLQHEVESGALALTAGLDAQLRVQKAADVHETISRYTDALLELSERKGSLPRIFVDRYLRDTRASKSLIQTIDNPHARYFATLISGMQMQISEVPTH